MAENGKSPTGDRRQVYDMLRTKTGYKGTYDEFNKNVDEQQGFWEKAYAAARMRGGYKGSESDFNALLGTSEESAAAMPTEETKAVQVDNTANKPSEEGGWADVLKRVKNQNGPIDFDGAKRKAALQQKDVVAKTDAVKVAIPKVERKPVTADDLQRKAQKVVNDAEDKHIDYQPKQVNMVGDIIDNYDQMFKLTQRGQELMDEYAGAEKKVAEKYTKLFQATDDYKDIVKNYKGEELDNKLNERFLSLYQDKMTEELKPYDDTYSKELYDRYGDKIKAEQVAFNKKAVGNHVAKLNERIDKDLDEAYNGVEISKNGMRMDPNGLPVYEETYDSPDQYMAVQQLKAAKKTNEESMKIINEAGKKGHTTFVGALGRGTRDAFFDADNWTLGLNDLAKNLSLSDIVKKTENGQKLTKSEEALMDACVTNLATSAYYGSDLTSGYKAGQTTGQSIPFMLEFAVNPVAGSGSAIAKGILKYGIKKFGKAAMKRNLIKMTARLAGDAAAAAGMTATTGTGRVAAGTIERKMGDIKYDIDDNGEIKYAGREGMQGTGEALARSFASTYIENQSEMVFNAFKGAGGALWGALERKAPGAMTWLSKSKAGDAYRFIKEAAPMGAAKKAMERLQLTSYPEEVMEEVYGNFANVAIGEMSMDDALSLDNNIDIMLGLAPTSAAFALLGMGGMAKRRIQTYRNAKKAEKAFLSQLSQQELDMVESLHDKKDISDLVKRTVRDQQLSPEAKKAIIRLAYNRAEQLANDELRGEQTAEENAADDAYMAGVEQDHKANYNTERTRAEIERDLNAVDENIVRKIDRLVDADATTAEVETTLSGMDAEAAQKAREYYHATLAEMGAIDNIGQSIEDQAKEYNEQIADVTDEGGNVTTAQYHNQTVFVISKTGNYAKVRFADGHEEEVLSDKISDELTTPAERLTEAKRMQLQQQAQTELGERFGKHPKTQEPQKGVVVWQGDVPYIITDVKPDAEGNQEVTAYPAGLNKKSGQMEAKGGSTPITLTRDEAIDLQNDYYSAQDAERSKADAPRTMDNDAQLDAVEANNMSENGAENTGTSSVGQSNVSENGLVMRKDGTPDFVASGEGAVIDYLSNKYGEKAGHKVDVTAKAADEALTKVEQELAKAQSEYDDMPIGSEGKAEDALNNAQQAYDAAKREADFWNSMIGKMEAPVSESIAQTEETTSGTEQTNAEAGQQPTMGTDSEEAHTEEYLASEQKQERVSQSYPRQAMSKHTQKACEAVAKALGMDVQWVDHMEANGEYVTRDENGNKLERPIIRIARDAENPIATVFGHEGTHAVRDLSEEAYQSLIGAARSVVGEEEWNRRMDKARRIYKKQNLTESELEEEVVADIVGEMINDRRMAEQIAYRLDHPTLSALRDVVRKMWNAIKAFVGSGKLTEQEQSVKDFMDTIERAFQDANVVYAGEAAAPMLKGMAIRFAENFNNYQPQAMPISRGTLTGNASAPTRHSMRQTILGAGLTPHIGEDGKVTLAAGNQTFGKNHHLTVDDLKRADSPLVQLVNSCVKEGVLKDADMVFRKYTDFLNRVLDKGDKGFEYLSDQWAWTGEALYKSVSNNSDAQYSKSVDITRVCKKNEAVINAICELQLKQRYGVTPGQVLDLYNASIEQGFQVPCPVCYVFSRYINNGQYASALIQGKELYGDKIKDVSKMTPAQRTKYVQEWLDELSAIEKWKADHADEIAKAKQNLGTIMQAVDVLAEDITSGKLTGALRTNAEKRVRALSKLYQNSLDIVNYASLDGWIKNFAIFKKGGKDVNEADTNAEESEGKEVTAFNINEWFPREDTYREGSEIYPDSVALDLRRAAEASVEYPGIERFRHSRGAAAGKAIQLAADNALGETAELLGIANPENREQNYSALQKAYTEASPQARAKFIQQFEKRIHQSIVYAAQQTLRGGIRQWSWSDNIERLSPDVFVNLLQIHMIGGALQAYSKQLEGVELVASMNGYVNGSLMGKGIGYKEVSSDYEGQKYYNKRNGKYYALVFDNVVGIEPFDHDGKHGLFYLNEMYDRAGNIIVGMDDTHVLASMADPRIFFIIPWHKSGMSNHILMQMYSYLGVPLEGLEGARDYTDVQEEKKYNASDNVPKDVQKFWESHNYSDKFRSGIGTIESGRMGTDKDGKPCILLSESQLHYRELRNALLEHNSHDVNDKFWQEHQNWLREIEEDEFLSQVRMKVKSVNDLGETMTTKDTSFVYPYEYWDMQSTYDTADVNGQRYLEYCRRMGFQPKFVGIAQGKFTDFGSFADEPGYWKLLIDRRMYDTKGRFQDLTPVTVDGFNPDLCDPEKTSERFDVTKVADDAKTKDIVERAMEIERERGYAKTDRTRSRQFVPQPKYDSSSTQASRATAREKAVERYKKAALADGRILADAKRIIEEGALKNWEKAKSKKGTSEEELARLKNEYDQAKKERKSAEKAVDSQSAKTKGAQNVEDGAQNVEDGKRYSLRTHSRETALRDAVIDVMRTNGMEVITDVEAGQRVLDMANEQSKGIRLALEIIKEESDNSRQPMAEPSRHTGKLSDSDAKVDNRIELSSDYKEKLSALSKRIDDGEVISPENFLLSVEDALGGDNGNADKTQYFKGEGDTTLRLANHRGSATMFLVHDHVTGNTSVVVKLSDKKFKKNDNVDLKEFVYFPDKMNADVMRSIISGLLEWGETGVYDRSCDQINVSTMNNGVRYMVVRKGDLTDKELDLLVNDIEKSLPTIKDKSTEEIYNIVRQIAEMNHNAFKGYGALSYDERQKNNRIYSLKSAGLRAVVEELLNRGEKIGVDEAQGIVYFRDKQGRQISFHGFHAPTSVLDKLDKNAKWDGKTEAWRNDEDIRTQNLRKEKLSQIDAKEKELKRAQQSFYEKWDRARKEQVGANWFVLKNGKATYYQYEYLTDDERAKISPKMADAITEENKALAELRKLWKERDEILDEIKSIQRSIKLSRKQESIDKAKERLTEAEARLEENEHGDATKQVRHEFDNAKSRVKEVYEEACEEAGKKLRQIDADREEDYNDTIAPLENDLSQLGKELEELRYSTLIDSDKVRFFRTADGEAYGYTIGGKIYIDPRIANAETPVHEYAHLWATALRNGNAEEWANVVELMKDTPVWKEVKKLYPELKSDDEIADEVLAHYSGKRGAERLRKAEEEALQSKDVMEAAASVAAVKRVRDALKRFWKGVCDFLHIHYTSAEEVADRMMKDLLDGVDPRKFGVDERLREQFVGEKGAKNADHAEEVTTRLDNLQVAREMEASKKDAKAIKMATGWERGADGKWRYEIPDFKFVDSIDMTNPYKHRDIYDIMDFNSYSRMRNLYYQKNAPMPEVHIQRVHAITKEEEEMRKDRVVAYVDKEDSGKVNITLALGSDYWNDNNVDLSSPKIQSILNHEVQHVIQLQEGFAEGGSEHLVSMKSFTEMLEADYEKAAEHLDEVCTKYGIGRFNALDEEFDAGDNAELKEAISKFNIARNKILKGSFDRYQSLAGEVEARNVQKRMGMSDAERRASLAAETEDVAREDQIFLFSEGSESHYEMPNDELHERISQYDEANGTELGRLELNRSTDITDMTDAVDELADMLGLDNVDIVTDTTGLSGRRAKAKGWFDPKTGRITIVVGNNADVADVKQTLLHEAVAHYGLRELLGDGFDGFLDDVYSHASADVRAKIDAMTSSYGGDVRKATEEYLASLAENTDFEKMSKGWWQKIKNLFRNALRAIGIDVDVNDNELRYMLWRSHENLRNGRGDLMSEAVDVLKQQKLGVGEFAEAENVAHKDGFVGKEENDVLFRDGNQLEHREALAREAYNRRVASGMYQSREALQDSMLGLRVAMEEILKGEGKGKVQMEDIAGYENAYLGENRLSSVSHAECEAFKNLFFDPLLEEVARLAKTSDERAALTDYMMGKHGLERNKVFARRDADKDAAAIFESELKKAEAAIAKDPNDVAAQAELAKVQQQIQNKSNELYLENRKKDYSGLTSLMANEPSIAAIVNQIESLKAQLRKEADQNKRNAISKKIARRNKTLAFTAEREAEIMVADYEAKHNTDELWKRTNGVTNAILQKQYESGMIDKEQYNKVKDIFEYYIPLRGFAENTAEDVYDYLSNGKHGMGGASIKAARGRKSKADDPFANMQAMAEAAITQGNRNVLVKQRFLNFVLNHPSDMASVNDLWLRYDDVADEWVVLKPGDVAGTDALKEDDSAAEIERKMEDFENAVKVLATQSPDKFKRQKEHPEIDFRPIQKSDELQHQVIVKRGGKNYVITINGNPRVAQAINGLTNPDVDNTSALAAIENVGQWINRKLSGLYTTQNVDFIVSNFLRDMVYANTMVYVKEGSVYGRKFHGNVARFNPVVMKRLFAKLRKNKLDMSNETERLFKEFIENGGETGYSNVRNIEKHKQDILRQLKKNNGQIPTRQAWDFFFERLDEYNRSVENVARLAAFVTSKQMGRSTDRSIYDAKEISVNFNKKGSGSKFMLANGQTRLGKASAFTSGIGRSFYVFWNAGVQGTTNFGRQLKRHPKKAIPAMSAMFILGALAAYMGGDDDDNSYYNLPDNVRKSNLLVRVGDSWISTPLPVEYRAFYGMGELAMSVLSGKQHMSDGELAMCIAEQISQMMPLDMLEGGGGMMPFVPSSVKPVAEVLANVSWTGMPIYKDNDYAKKLPEWMKAYKGTNQTLVKWSKELNEATGGNAYKKGTVNINPAVIEHLLEGYLGGISSMAGKAVKMYGMTTGEQEYDPKNVLLLNRVVKRGDGRTKEKRVTSDYYKNVNRMDEIGTQISGFKKEMRRTYRNPVEYAEWRKLYNDLRKSDEYKAYEEFKRGSKHVQKLKKHFDQTGDDEVKDKMIELQQDLNRKVSNY